MSSAVPSRLPDAAEVAALDVQHVAQLLRSQAAANEVLRNQIEALRAQIEWFRRQIFGQKSERHAPLPDAQQLHLGEYLGELMPVAAAAPEAEQDVPAHKRRKARSDFTDDAAGVPFFDEARVPVVSIDVPNPEVQGLSAEEVARHRRPEAQPPPGAAPGRLRGAEVRAPGHQAARHQTLHWAPAPVGVIEGSRADVSFIVGVIQPWKWDGRG